MKSKAATIDEYLETVPNDKKAAFEKLRETIRSNLPEGFEEAMSYGMIGYVVPHKIYPPGYHVSPKLPLPFVNIASQKNHIALYHLGLYSQPELLSWFLEQYKSRSKIRLDMGKSCLRFKKTDQIPYELIAELMQKISVNQWIEIYEQSLTKKGKYGKN